MLIHPHKRGRACMSFVVMYTSTPESSMMWWICADDIFVYSMYMYLRILLCKLTALSVLQDKQVELSFPL